jgi:transcriptional regulator with XRE-family HTH domain
VRALRRRRRWRQEDLARACGLSRTTISRIELGNGDLLTVRTLDQVAAALGGNGPAASPNDRLVVA